MTYTPPKMSLEALRARSTITLAEAGAFLDMSAATAYRAADTGHIPTIRVGERRRVPVALLLALLGIPFEPVPPEVAPV